MMCIWPPPSPLILEGLVVAVPGGRGEPHKGPLLGGRIWSPLLPGTATGTGAVTQPITPRSCKTK